jgi:hypothetical protein
LCLILIDQVEEALAHIQKRVDEAAPARPAARQASAGKPRRRKLDTTVALGLRL